MKKLLSLFAFSFIVGCSAMTHVPTINTKADKNVAAVDEDLEYCKKLAMTSAGYASESFGDTLAAAGYAASVGAISGALIPGAVSAGTGAAIGAPIGAVTGLFWGLYEADETFARSYDTCMVQLNHPVLR